MASSIRFESAWAKEAERDAVRKARKQLLEDAKDKAERRDLQRKRTGEDHWMLPDIEQQIATDDDKRVKKRKKKKKKEDKKQKKEKKAKKKKSKRSRKDSSSDSDEEWVEKPCKAQTELPQEKQESPRCRQSWMELGGALEDYIATSSAKDSSSSRGGETSRQRERREQEKINREQWQQRELNPNLSGGARQEVSQKFETKLDASWLRKAFKRAQERAEAEGRTVEEIAEERWGSLKNFQKLLAKAEGEGEESRGGSRGRRLHASDSRDRKYHSPSRDQEHLSPSRHKRHRSPSRDRRHRSRSRDRKHRSRSRDRKHRSRSRDSYSRSREEQGWRKRQSRLSDRRRSSSSSSGERRKKQRSFARPGSGDEKSSAKVMIPQTSRTSSGWKTAERRARDVEEMKRKRRSSSSSSSSSDEEREKLKEPVQAEPQQLMSEKEKNALGAKIIKAEILGNEELAKKLKAKLEAAREAEANKDMLDDGDQKAREEMVVLTRTDAKGLTRPVEALPSIVQSGSRRKKSKVQTHGADGKRDRYFADDDRHSLMQMFEREKLGTAEDQNQMLSRLAGRKVDRTNEDYDLDDMFADRAAKKDGSSEKEKMRERERAIAEHREEARALEECRLCLPNATKHLLIALGRSCYLALPAHTSLAEGHCYIAPITHCAAITAVDEDIYAEMQDFRRALVKMFAAKDQDCVFFESAVHLKRKRQHASLVCVPLDAETGAAAPMFFRKAIQECETEWAHNVKLIELAGKKGGVRGAIPKGLPYFSVDFGLQDGYAHVVEDERIFTDNFAQGKCSFDY